MSMEDILKVLVNSRQQGNSSSQSSDPMADLIGGLLGGQQPTQGANQQGGLGDMMGMLEMVMGGNQAGSMNQAAAGNDPLMMLLQPFVAQLAKKINVPPEIAMIVVSLVAHKLLSHHPTSGRDSNSFDLDDMLSQMNSGNINSNVLNQSGMIREVSQRTGMSEADSEKALSTALTMFGSQLGGRAVKSAKTSGAASAGKSLKSAGVRTGKGRK
ncbi:MAG: hypothetical protein RIR73_1961 [Chloroflexota bacterium]|jgi:hypothetical protein